MIQVLLYIALIRFVRKISTIQAWRAFMYIQKLLGNSRTPYEYYQKMFLIIKESNRKILIGMIDVIVELLSKKRSE